MEKVHFKLKWFKTIAFKFLLRKNVELGEHPDKRS